MINPLQSSRLPLLVVVAVFAVAPLSTALGATAPEKEAEAATETKQAVPPSCGNGLLDASEDCKICPQDCTVSKCTATTSKHDVAVSFQWPPGTYPDTVVMVVSYRSNRLSLPGNRQAPETQKRLKSSGPFTAEAVFDMGYAARVVIGHDEQLPADLFRLEFDGCQGVGAPTADDLSCYVESCAMDGAAVVNCGCRIEGISAQASARSTE
jgi:hypothetical protein